MGAMFRKKSPPMPSAASKPYSRQTAPIEPQHSPEISRRGVHPEVPPAEPLDASSWNIPRPNLVESFIPVVGPLWEAVADAQDGNYGSAAFNGAMAVTDVLPVAPVFKLLKIMKKLRAAGKLSRYEEGLASASAMQKRYKTLKLTQAGQELHHTIPHRFAGISRTTKSAINHPALLKPMDKATHRRLTGRWQGQPEFNRLEKLWHGTTDLQKTAPVGAAGNAADAWENLRQPRPPRDDGRRR